jgi:hypothetical protein
MRQIDSKTPLLSIYERFASSAAEPQVRTEVQSSDTTNALHRLGLGPNDR